MSLTTDRGSQLRLGLYFAAILTLLAVYWLPQTHRVVREDMTTALRVCGFNPPGRTGGPNEAYAAAHPDDDAVQVALAGSRDPRKGESQNRSTVRYLAPLLDRYPRSVLVRAAIVRYATGFNSATAAERKEFARAAAEGERLEPDNAVFPAMAWVLASSEGDTRRADQALLRAAAKSRWDEHVPEEVQGRWRLAKGDGG